MSAPTASLERIVQINHRLLEALQDREHQLAQAQRLARIGSWQWDIAHDVVSWSDELYRIFGLESGDLEPTFAGVLAHLHPDDARLLTEVVQRSLETLEPYVLDLRFVRPDGSVGHGEARGEVVTDADGKPIKLHGTLRDRSGAARVIEHFREVSSAFELVRETTAVFNDATAIHDGLQTALGEACRRRSWRAARVWSAIGPPMTRLAPTGISYGRRSAEPSQAAIQALDSRQLETDVGPARRVTAAPPRHATIAAPVVVDDELVYVLEFDLGGDEADDLVVAAIESLCSTIALRVSRERAAALVDGASARFATLLRFAHEAVTVLAADGTILYATPATTRLFGYAPGSKIGTSVFDLLHPDDRDSTRRRFLEDPRPDTTRVNEARVVHADGSIRYIEVTTTDIADDASIDGAVVVNLRDVTDRKLAELQLAGERSHDPLTGLTTRSLFVEHVQRALAMAARNGWSTAVLSIDIDQFHCVNDDHGHDVGDQVLVTVAHRLRAAIREHDTTSRADNAVTRVGGDEFLLMCENVRDESAALSIARRVSDAIAEPIDVAAGPVMLTASIGIAMCPGTGGAQKMIADAESAQREAKGAGPGNQHFFTPELHRRAVAAAALVDDLRVSLERDQLRLAYQPKVALDSNRIVGVEALLRWDHPRRGPIPPSEFIPAAESSGLIVAIGEWVLRQACQQTASWRRAYPRTSLTVAVNVSARQFRSGLATSIATIVAESGIEGAAVCLEMTETTVMDDIAATVGVLNDLKNIGLTVSIDDFGTGYSSLEYLHRMPIDEIKIDRSFVGGLGVDPHNTAIVASVISLAHAMDLDVVAEGVETGDQLERLRSLGCDVAQGYLFARPVSAAEMEALLAADSAGRQLVPATAGGGGDAAPAAADSVLVVDDTADIRMLAKMSLTAAGFTVEEAGNGAAGIALARQLQPDCVLLDVSMPDMSGIDVCRALRADTSTSACTIVMLTTHANASDKAEAFLAGADDYIVKPFAPRELVARIRSAVRRRRTTVHAVGGDVDSALYDMLKALREDEESSEALPEAERLSTRQIEIVKRLLGGERVPGIARSLYLSQSTVRNHLSSIYQRLGVHSQEELLMTLRRKSTASRD